MIPFSRPTYLGVEDQYMMQAIRDGHMSGDGPFSHKCHQWFEAHLGAVRSLLTPSCTHALEMAALLIDVQPGDEIIMPSYTFVSTANAFVLRGARIVFVDIDPVTLNIDVDLIEGAITDRTRAIVPVHYAGVSCDMQALMEVAGRHDLYVIEDAAQALMSSYRGRPLGALGHMSAFSFHETKNYTSGGEGGLLVLNHPEFVDRAEILREKGTNRSQFFRGAVDKYSWVDIGSSYLLSDLQAAYLWGQLENADLINQQRLRAWRFYAEALMPLVTSGRIECQQVPRDQTFNAHMFFLKCAHLEERTRLITALRNHGVQAAFHYVPLHTSTAGRRFGRLHGEDRHTSRESERLLRLPLWHGIEREQQAVVVDAIKEFYQ